MEWILFMASYLLIGAIIFGIILPKLKKETPDQYVEFGCLVMLLWPIFIAVYIGLLLGKLFMGEQDDN